MTSVIRAFTTKALALIVLISVLGLAACGSTTTTTGGSTSVTTKDSGTITVASKLDLENQLLAEMYILLLQKAGYTVNPKLALGNTPTTFEALQSGDIDIYPEFTATGLNTLGITSAYDPQKDYQAVKSGFESKYKITWLDASPLNDGYAICMPKAHAQSLGIATISDLAKKVSTLKLESPSDGIPFIDNLQKTYGFTTKSFAQTQTVLYSVGITAVADNQADAAVCYTTDGSIAQQNFIFLKDDKNGFPAFNPAPIVRDSVLAKYKDIGSILNPLAPKLTTEVSIQLQQQVSDKKTAGTSSSKAVQLVATSFLQQNGLL
jgi:osmoprotectant transport system substrate-binding protein